MLIPAIEAPRCAPALLAVAGSLILIASQREVATERLAPEPPRIVCGVQPPIELAPSLTARVSPRNGAIDELSPDLYRGNGTGDEVLDVELTSDLAVRHIFVTGNGGSHQWDTVIGSDPIPYGRVFGGHRGDATWHLGVREAGAWRTNPQTGALAALPAGIHRLELIGDGVYDGFTSRTVTVMFVDGTTIAAEVAGPSRNCYGAQDGGCDGTGNAN